MDGELTITEKQKGKEPDKTLRETRLFKRVALLKEPLNTYSNHGKSIILQRLSLQLLS